MATPKKTNAPPRAAELSGAVSRYTAVLPVLQRVEVIDLRLAEIDRELRGLRGPLPKAEVEPRLVAWLHDRRERFEGPETPGGRSGARCGLVDALSMGKTPRLDSLSPEETLLDWFLWLLGPHVEDFAREALARLDYAPGPSSAERTRTREALGREREQLVSEREHLVDECGAAGVELQHLPETWTRRRDEARRQELAERQLQRRREVGRQLDAADAGAASLV